MKGYNHKGLFLIIADIHFLFELPLYGESLLSLVSVRNLSDHYDFSVSVFVCVPQRYWREVIEVSEPNLLQRESESKVGM